MPTCRLLLLTLCAVRLVGAPSPREAIAMMQVAPGFEVRCVASEPNIRQPVSVSFDERGRMWVIQYLQYPTPAGLKAISVDQYLRTKYDRVPEPPPRGPRGLDRITICEDTNGDGVADTFKDFVSGLNLASGMALGRDGVFIAQPPYLLYYADTNHDDIPDGPPQVLLSGFGIEDSHALANSLTWGPDGWLYGAQGSTVTARIRGIEFQQGIWRYHPITHEFELFAEGGGNTWGLDFDEDGEVLAGTNFGEQIALHQVQGGYYLKGFAKHGPLHNPHTYGYLDHIPYTGWKGGRVICGGVVYHGGLFADTFSGTYVAANLLRRSVDWHVLERNGSTWQGHFGGSFIQTEDNTFRPVDCTVGPDGAVYVADWCDARASHVDPVDNWDKDTGRIYRIAPSNQKASPKFNLRDLSSERLLNELTNGNEWYRREARVLLTERLAGNTKSELLATLKKNTRQKQNGRLALESLWTLASCGVVDEALARELLAHPEEAVRAWAVRLMGDTRAVSESATHDLITIARREKSARVRSQMACSAKRWPTTAAVPIVRELMRHDVDLNDTHIPLLLWWAVEDKLSKAPEITRELLKSDADWSLALVRGHLLERVARRCASETNKAVTEIAAWLLSTAHNAQERSAVLRGFDAAWQGQRAPKSDAIAKAFSTAWNDRDATAIRVGVRIAFEKAIAAALQRITNNTASEAERIGLIETLGECEVAEAPPVLVKLLRDKTKIQVAALGAIQRFNQVSLGQSILDVYPAFSSPVRARARGVLVSRPSWALQLISAVELERIEAKEIGPDQLQQLARYDDAQIRTAVERRWGKLQAQTSEEKLSTINKLKLVLNPSGTTHRFKGDVAHGKELFTQVCGTCHKLYGEGNIIGPELTGSDRKNVDWLLQQIVDPSAFIRPEFVNHNVEMKDGRSFTGLIAEQSDSAITILDAQNQRTVLTRSEVKEIAPSAISLMPEGLLEPLQPQDVRDLFSYLQAK